MCRHFFILLIISISITDFAFAQDEDKIIFNIKYEGDVVGINQNSENHHGYLGYASMGIILDSEKLGLWNGTLLCVGGGNTHGMTPSFTYIGDFQIFDNIEGGDYTFLENLWIKHQNEKLFVKAGIQNLNDSIAVCDVSSDFINSSFGLTPVICNNCNAPTFPFNGLGIEIGYNFNEKWSALAAVFNNVVIDREKNEHNLNFDLSNGTISFLEVQYDNRVGNYLFGGFYNSDNYVGGFYAIVQHHIVQLKNRNIAVFGECSFTTNNDFHIAGGSAMNGVFSKKQRDSLGTSFTSIFFKDDGKTETAIEGYYKYEFIKNISVQPGIQYIINPNADCAKTAKDNAFVYMARMRMNL